MNSTIILKCVAGLVLLSMTITTASIQGQGGPSTCFVTNFLTVSESDDVVREVNPDTLEVISEFPMSISGSVEIDGLRGIAVHPTTGNWFMLGMLSLPPSPAPSPWLLEYDPINLTLNLVGFTVLDFNDLEFTEAGEIRAITNTLSTGESNYCELSVVTGGPLDLCQYDGSDGGDSIALGDGEEVFRASGGYTTGGAIQFERPVVMGANNCESTNIALSAALTAAPVRSLTYWDSEDLFIWVQDDVDNTAYLIDEDGQEQLLGEFDHLVNGIALIEIPTPCPPGDTFIRGDCNLDMGVNVADAVYLLGSLFIPGSPQVMCGDAGDCNDDGGMNVADAVYLLGSLFIPGSPSIPEPNIVNGCGTDPTDTDPLQCDQSNCP
ncbi:MAG: hypothetical protein VX764_02175 [Planctomycetota bacterium]|nr:hypothetical protein [Planctomycetota bacterium]